MRSIEIIHSSVEREDTPTRPNFLVTDVWHILSVFEE